MTPGNPRAKVSSPLSKSTIEEVSCDICHGSDFRIVAQPASLYSQDRYRVVQCRRCDLVFVNPRARSFEAEYEANASPVRTLRAIRKYLKPTGLLYVDVPNYDFLASRIERIIGSNLTRHWDPTAHLHYFTVRTLRRVARAAGFVPQWIFTGAPQVLR